MNTVECILSPIERHNLSVLGQSLITEAVPGFEKEFVDLVRTVVCDPRINRGIDRLISELGSAIERGAQVLRISGLPFSDAREVPPTPSRYQPPETADILLQDIAPLVIYAALEMEPRGYIESRGGRIINDIMPRPGFENKPDSAFGAAAEFSWHADLAYTPPFQPKVVGMHCLRNTEQAVTEFVNPQEVLTDELVEELCAAEFNIYSGPDRKNQPRLSTTPLLYNGTQGWYTNIEPCDEQSQVFLTLALNSLRNSESRLPIMLAPGDAVLWDNTKLLHRRLPFTPATHQKNRRWLRRMYLY